MFDSHAQNDRALIFGGGKATKLSLGPGLDSNVLDAIFGAGTGDELASRNARSLSPQVGWTRQGWFRKCADVRAKSVANMPWAIYPLGAENDAEPLWKDDDVSVPDGLSVLDGLDMLLYLSEASLSLTGAAYFGKSMAGQGQGVPGSMMGRFSGLMYWAPGTVEPKLSPQGVMRFDRRIGSAIVPVDPEAVVWIWQPDPFVEIGAGSADGGAAATGAAALDSLARFLTRHLDTGLIKMTVLGVEGTTTPAQRSELRSVWDRLLRRGSDVDGPPVLGSKVTPHVIGEGLKDIANKEITAEQRQAVSTSFGIPWSILTSESANFATAQVEERGFYLRTVIPQSRIIERALNTRLFKDYDLSFRFEPERHEVMQAWELEKAEKVRLVVGKSVLTRNEGRELLGYEPVDGWDESDLNPVAPPLPISGDGSTLPVRSVQVEPKSLQDRLAEIVGGGW